MPEIPDEQIQFTISDQLFLDVLLMEIRVQTISYSIREKRKSIKKEKDLEKGISVLENKSQLNEIEKDLLNDKKNELNEIRKTKIEGIILHSKARWTSQGEKVTKYFCSLEKRHFISKKMIKLVSHSGDVLLETDDMLQETKNFYEKLYSARQTEEIDIND